MRSSIFSSELVSRLFVVFLGIFVYRLGSYVPLPGVDLSKVSSFLNFRSGGIFTVFNTLSGGSLKRLTLFSLGIMPYISASILIQLLASVIPSLSLLKKEGEQGQRKISRYTRFLTLFLALFQSLGVANYLLSKNLVSYDPVLFFFVCALSLPAGAMFLMWLGEFITERGFGNGISLIILCSILSGAPPAFFQILTQLRQENITFFSILFAGSFFMLLVAFVVFIERGQRRIKVSYSARTNTKQGRLADATHLPFKINMAGVIPPVFAMAVLLFPSTLSEWFSSLPYLHWLGNVSLALSFGQPAYFVFFVFSVIFFCFFYTALIFSPADTAENLKKSGAFILGVRPGEQTAKHIDKIVSRLTLIGSLYVTTVCLLPMLLALHSGFSFYFGGTSLLIAVVVVMDFFSQISMYFLSGRYASLMKKGGL